MKHITLIGATGKTGQLFLSLALQNGYKVSAIARNSNNISMKHPQLTTIQCDVLDLTSLESKLPECDVVVSLFGHVKDSPEWLQTNGTKNIIAVMKKKSISKIISLSGGGLPFPEKDQPKFADKLIRKIMALLVPKILNDAIKHHEVLKSSSLKWIIVRGPRLTNNAPKGIYRVGWVGVNASTKIARGDLAHFILSQIESDAFLYQMPFVSY